VRVFRRDGLRATNVPANWLPTNTNHCGTATPPTPSGMIQRRSRLLIFVKKSLSYVGRGVEQGWRLGPLKGEFLRLGFIHMLVCEVPCLQLYTASSSGTPQGALLPEKRRRRRTGGRSCQ
jgi:hypothetical protein